MANPNADVRPPSKRARVTVRFDEVEHARVARWAAARGVAPSVLMRAAVLDVVDDGAVPPSIAAAAAAPQGQEVDSGALRELRAEVNRVGVNLNQLTRRVNSEGTAVLGSPEAAARLREVGEVLASVESLLGGTRRAR